MLHVEKDIFKATMSGDGGKAFDTELFVEPSNACNKSYETAL